MVGLYPGLYRVFLASASVCKVTLEKRSYARTHTTNYIQYSALSRIEVDGTPRRVAMSKNSDTVLYYRPGLCVRTKFI